HTRPTACPLSIRASRAPKRASSITSWPCTSNGGTCSSAASDRCSIRGCCFPDAVFRLSSESDHLTKNLRRLQVHGALVVLLFGVWRRCFLSSSGSAIRLSAWVFASPPGHIPSLNRYMCSVCASSQVCCSCGTCVCSASHSVV